MANYNVINNPKGVWDVKRDNAESQLSDRLLEELVFIQKHRSKLKLMPSASLLILEVVSSGSRSEMENFAILAQFRKEMTLTLLEI